MIRMRNEGTLDEDINGIRQRYARPLRQEVRTSPRTGVRQARDSHELRSPVLLGMAGPAGRVVALVCAGIVLAGCTGAPADAGTTAPRPSVGPAVTGISSPSQVTRPIDTYFLSSDQVAATEFARIRSLGACMTRKGYQAPEIPAETNVAESLASAVADRVARSDLYGFFDTPDNARRYGYQRAPGASSGLGLDWSSDMTQEEVDVCFAEAAKPIGFDDAMDLVLAQKLPAGGPAVPSGDPVYVAAVKAWAACMSEHGYTYPDPQAALGDGKWHDDLMAGKASTAQIATATADVQCKISTNLIGVAVAVQAAYDKQYIDAHTDQLTAYRERLQQAVKSTGGTGSSS